MTEPIDVLLVEDDPDLRDTLIRCLAIAGFRVTGAGSALEFYQVLSQAPFQAAIIDIGLPDQSGLVLADYLRHNTAQRIIILTARGGITERVEGYAVGADLYLVKPVDVLELAAALGSLVRRGAEAPGPSPPMSPSASPPASPSRPAEPPVWLLQDTPRRLSRNGREAVPLTGREYQLLLVFARAGGAAVPRPDLLAGLHHIDWADRADFGRALDNLIVRLRRKLREQLGLDPIVTVRGIGYRCTVALRLPTPRS